MRRLRPQIFTFYSFKGGVGRTMAAANAACVLAAKYKRRVILVDWDLDAPGLHWYFNLSDQELRDRKGLMDYLEDFRDEVRRGAEGVEPDLDEYLSDPAPDIAGKLPEGSVRILHCGRTDA